MEHIEYEEEEPISSQQRKAELEMKQFRKYLVQSGCAVHFVKFLLGLRGKQKQDEGVPSSDLIQMFKDYIGAVEIDHSQHDEIKLKNNQTIAENETMKAQIEIIKKQIKELWDKKEKALEEKRLKQQQQAKNPKKGGKK